MGRRVGGILVLGTVLLLVIASAAAAALPPGPRLAVVKLELRGRTELFTVDPLGAGRESLYAAGIRKAPAVAPFFSPAWSPDGTRIVFTAISGQFKGKYRRFPRTMLAEVSAEGGNPEPVPGTAGGSSPVFAPTAGTSPSRDSASWKPNDRGGVSQTYESVSIWMADLVAGTSTRLTPWRNDLHQIPTSFSPDGSSLAFTRYVGQKAPEAMAMAFDGTADTVLAQHAAEPVYSPDGHWLAFLRGPVKITKEHSRTRNSSSTTVTTARMTDIYVQSVDRGDRRRLTETPNVLESAPRWDPSSQRLAYTALKPFGSELAFFGFGDAVMEINADGSCRTKVLSGGRKALYGATWQPGLGREAGPINC
jgi:Tol biopolymer transport system component